MPDKTNTKGHFEEQVAAFRERLDSAGPMSVDTEEALNMAGDAVELLEELAGGTFGNKYARRLRRLDNMIRRAEEANDPELGDELREIRDWLEETQTLAAAIDNQSTNYRHRNKELEQLNDEIGAESDVRGDRIAELEEQLEHANKQHRHYSSEASALRSRVDDLKAENESLSKFVAGHIATKGDLAGDGDDLAGLENAVAEIESDREAYREWSAERAELEERLAAMVVALRIQNKTAESYKRAADRHIRQVNAFSDLVHKTLDFWRLERRDDGKILINSEQMDQIAKKAARIYSKAQPEQTLGEFMIGQWKDEEKRADNLEAENAKLEAELERLRQTPDEEADPNSAKSRVARMREKYEGGLGEFVLDEEAVEQVFTLADYLADDLEEIRSRIQREGRRVDGLGPVSAVCGLILDFRDLKAKCETREFQLAQANGKLEAHKDTAQKVRELVAASDAEGTFQAVRRAMEMHTEAARKLEQVIEPICEAVGLTNYEEARDYVVDMSGAIGEVVGVVWHPGAYERDPVPFDQLVKAIEDERGNSAALEDLHAIEEIVGYSDHNGPDAGVVGRVRNLAEQRDRLSTRLANVLDTDELDLTADLASIAESLAAYIGEPADSFEVVSQVENIIRRCDKFDDLVDLLSTVTFEDEPAHAIADGLEHAKFLLARFADWSRERQHIEKRLDAELAKIAERNDFMPETPTLERKVDLFANVHTSTRINQLAAEGRLEKVRQILRGCSISALTDRDIQYGVTKLAEERDLLERQRNELAEKLDKSERFVDTLNARADGQVGKARFERNELALKLEAVDSALEAAGLRSHEAHENDEPAELVELLARQRDENKRGAEEWFKRNDLALKLEAVVEELHETGLDESDYIDDPAKGVELLFADLKKSMKEFDATLAQRDQAIDELNAKLEHATEERNATVEELRSENQGLRASVDFMNGWNRQVAEAFGAGEQWIESEDGFWCKLEELAEAIEAARPDWFPGSPVAVVELLAQHTDQAIKVRNELRERELLESAHTEELAEAVSLALDAYIEQRDEAISDRHTSDDTLREVVRSRDAVARERDNMARLVSHLADFVKTLTAQGGDDAN